MKLASETLALLIWTFLYIPTSLFVILVMIKELWTHARSNRGGRPVPSRE